MDPANLTSVAHALAIVQILKNHHTTGDHMTTKQTNAERSAAEVAAFTADTPGPYFAYWNVRGRWANPGVEAALIAGDLITTWTGDQLATITSVGHVWVSNVDDRRQSFRAKGINGATYSGTAYLSAGDYVRMRPVKA